MRVVSRMRMGDLVQTRERAGNKQGENYRFRQFLKTRNLEPGEIDRSVFEETALRKG